MAKEEAAETLRASRTQQGVVLISGYLAFQAAGKVGARRPIPLQRQPRFLGSHLPPESTISLKSCSLQWLSLDSRVDTCWIRGVQPGVHPAANNIDIATG